MKLKLDKEPFKWWEKGVPKFRWIPFSTCLSLSSLMTIRLYDKALPWWDAGRSILDSTGEDEFMPNQAGWRNLLSFHRLCLKIHEPPCQDCLKILSTWFQSQFLGWNSHFSNDRKYFNTLVLLNLILLPWLCWCVPLICNYLWCLFRLTFVWCLFKCTISWWVFVQCDVRETYYIWKSLSGNGNCQETWQCTDW